VIGEASDGEEAIALAQALHPDVILMDLVMPKIDGIEATRRITASQSGVRVLVLTSFAADDKVFPAIKAGALGYLLKDTGPDDLLRAIHQVHLGQPTLEPSIARNPWDFHTPGKSQGHGARSFPNLPTRHKSH
jgi:NarL family two-component system response regulator LiaR